MITDTNTEADLILEKKRAIPFSLEEDALLAECYNEFKDVIDSKLSSKVSAADKARVWSHIGETINAKSPTGTKRSVKDVKTRWKNLKRTTKEKFSEQRKSASRTGGGPPAKQMTPVEEHVAELLGSDPSFIGLSGLETKTSASA